MLFTLIATFLFIFSCRSQSCVTESYLPQKRYKHQTAYDIISNCTYIFGGTPDYQAGGTGAIYKRSMHQKDWITLNVSTPMTFMSDTKNSIVVNRIVYFIGMRDSSDYQTGKIYKFDMNTDNWLSNNHLEPPPHPSVYGCLTGNETDLFMIGGMSCGSCADDYLQMYNINNNLWIAEVINISPIQGNGWLGQYCNMVEDDVYVFGGFVNDGNGRIDGIFKYNSIDKWSTLPSILPIAVSYSASVYKHPYIYLVGGWDDAANPSNLIVEFNINTENISSTYILQEGIRLTDAEIINGKLYIFGGNSLGETITKNVEICDILKSDVATSTSDPSASPTKQPSRTPSNVPSRTPSNVPSRTPSNAPSRIPSNVPSRNPSTIPSRVPTSNDPTLSPSASSSISQQPSYQPSITPSRIPSKDTLRHYTNNSVVITVQFNVSLVNNVTIAELEVLLIETIHQSVSETDVGNCTTAIENSDIINNISMSISIYMCNEEAQQSQQLIAMYIKQNIKSDLIRKIQENYHITADQTWINLHVDIISSGGDIVTSTTLVTIPIISQTESQASHSKPATGGDINRIIIIIIAIVCCVSGVVIVLIHKLKARREQSILNRKQMDKEANINANDKVVKQIQNVVQLERVTEEGAAQYVGNNAYFMKEKSCSSSHGLYIKQSDKISPGTKSTKSTNDNIYNNEGVNNNAANVTQEGVPDLELEDADAEDLYVNVNSTATATTGNATITTTGATHKQYNGTMTAAESTS